MGSSLTKETDDKIKKYYEDLKLFTEKNICPKCESDDIVRMRRVSGYLSERDTLKKGKKEEEQERKSHL